MNISSNQKRKTYEWFFLVLIIFAAFWVRVDEFSEWRAEPDKYFYQGEPLLTTYDGYYYLTLARDLIEGTYDPIDTMRAVPDHPKRPSPPPLLSVIAANITKVLPFSLNWIGVTLPVFLGLLLAIPLYAFGRYVGGGVMALTTVMVGLLSSFYVSRSCLGWFDTDIMNVTFTMSISYCTMRFALEKKRVRYWFLFAVAILTLLFVLWWDQARMVATLISIIPFILALTFFYRPRGPEAKIFYGVLAFVIVCVIAWGGIELPGKLISAVWNKFLYISKKSGSNFPEMGVFIAEQNKVPLPKLVQYSISNWVAFVAGVIGFFVLCWRHHREMVFFLVPAVLACCAIFFASRFAIFFTPIFALGFGYFICLIVEKFQNSKVIYILVGVILLYLASNMHLKGKWRSPSVFGLMVAGMNQVEEITPDNAVIWNWCDVGYPLIYWGRRTTISDGQVHSGERSVYNAIPYIVSDHRLSANFIRFYVKRGVSGINLFYKAMGNDTDKGLKLIKEILGHGPESAQKILSEQSLEQVSWMRSTDDWLEFFYPKQSVPIYMFLDWHTNNLLHLLYWFGTWDGKEKAGEEIVGKVELAFGGVVDWPKLTTLSGMSADLEKGIMFLSGYKFDLKSVALTTEDKTVNYIYKNNTKGMVHLEINIDGDFSYVAHQSEKLGRTIFNKMYWRKNLPPEKYFKPVASQKPFYQLWKVGGDMP